MMYRHVDEVAAGKAGVGADETGEIGPYHQGRYAGASMPLQIHELHKYSEKEKKMQRGSVLQKKCRKAYKFTS